MQDYKVLFEERKAVVSPEFLSKMKYLTRGVSIYSSDSKEIGREMKLGLFYDMIESIAKSCYSSIEFLPNSNNEINYDTSNIEQLVEKFKMLFPNVEDYHQVGYKVREIDESKLGEILELSYNLHEEYKQYHLLRDLINARTDCIENMKYFVDENTISQWNVEYEKAIKEKDTKRMQNMLENVQNAILREWEKYIGNIQEMNDDNFAFIGHSTNSTKFEKDFMSRYISTSLLTQDVNDTYRSGYGFIFAPKNIVGAKGQDMYVNNYAEEDDMLLHYSTIKKIDHPRRLIDVCKKQKQENLDSGVNKSVYSEVVIDGFEPIGIFCFTDGSKSLNWNEKEAKKLQESFPNLKIYTFDVMKRKKGADLTQMKLKLINNLHRRKFPDGFDIKEDMLTRYDYFFEEFEKLKQSGNYDETMITSLFDENAKMLSVFDNDPENLFNGMYNEKKIKYILGKNVTYNIDYILSGKSKAFALNNLKKLYPYRDKLNSMFDGLSEFLEILSRMEITDEIMLEINSNESINFYAITKVLASKLMVSINSREEQSRQNLSDYQTKYDELQKELEARTIVQEQYDYYSSIYSNRFFAEMIKDDYKNLIKNINATEQEETELQSELSEVVNKLTAIDEKIKLLENSTYDDNVEHAYYKKTIEEIKINISELSKHPFINRKRIKEEKGKLKVFEEKDIIERASFESLKSEESRDLESEKFELQLKRESVELHLSFRQSDKNRLYEELDTLKSKIKDYFKCESVDEMDLVISKVENFMNQYDNLNQYYLTQLNMQLEELANMIINQQSNLSEIKEEKEIISRNM